MRTHDVNCDLSLGSLVRSLSSSSSSTDGSQPGFASPSKIKHMTFDQTSYFSRHALNDSRISALISSVISPVNGAHSGYPTKIADDIGRQHRLCADEARRMQQQHQRLFFLDELSQRTDRISSTSKNVPMGRFGNVVDGRFFLSLPMQVDHFSKHNASRFPLTPSAGTSITKVIIEEARRRLSSSPMVMGQPLEEVSLQGTKKRKRAYEKTGEEPPNADLAGCSSPPAAKKAALTPVKVADELDRVPIASSSLLALNHELNHQYLQERELWLHHGRSLRPTVAGTYDYAPYGVPLSLLGTELPTFPTVLRSETLSAGLAQSLTSELNAFRTHNAMMRFNDWLAHESRIRAATGTTNRDAPKAAEPPLPASAGCEPGSKVALDDKAQENNPTFPVAWALEPRYLDHGRSFALHVKQDDNNISPYQCLIRRQIEVFEASTKEAGTSAQGRNRPILAGQVGIRCRHCAKLEPKNRETGAVYFPNRLDGVYQTAQKMVAKHLISRCKAIAPETRENLLELKATARSSEGGRRYWSAALQLLGVEETESEGLILKKSVVIYDQTQ